MILRRLADGIKNQDWFVVMVEVLIVVVGIFIGLQVDDWNEGRKDRELEIEYLERLKADLRENLERFDRSDELVESRMAAVDLIERGVADPDIAAADSDTFIIAVNKVTWTSYQSVAPIAFAELVSTGRMTLLRDQQLRDSLSAYYQEIRDWERVLEKQDLREHFRFETTGLLTKETLVNIQMAANQPGPEIINSTANEAKSVATALGTRPDALKWLPALYDQNYLVRVINTRLRSAALDLVAEIDTALSEEGVIQ